jgi:hypothetical protein
MGVLALVLALSGCGVDSASEDSGTKRAPGSGAAPSTAAAGAGTTDLTPAATRIEQLCQSSFSDRYAGLELEDGQIVVYRMPSAQLDSAVRRLGTGASVVFRDAPYSARELAAVRDKVQQDIAYWQRQGVVVSTLAVNQKGTAVEVGTAQIDRARREFPRRYGPAPRIEVVTVGPIVLPTR